MKYSINKDGSVTSFGINERILLTDEPFDINTAHLYKKEGDEWIYLPDITPIDKTIEKCVYDWSINQVRIYIKDIYIDKPITTNCDSTWTDADCQTYIDNLEIER